MELMGLEVIPYFVHFNFVIRNASMASARLSNVEASVVLSQYSNILLGE
jgi:hypothetical protein